MKRHLLVAMLFAAGLMMTACENNPKNNENPAPKENGNKENVVTPDQPKEIEKEEEEKVVELSGIGEIKRVWANKTFEVEPGDITPGIEQYALAFCKTYPQYELNKVIADYLIDEKYDESMYEIVNDKKNGYLRCTWLVQFTNTTEVCFWNRKDGHQLVAAYMEANYENAPSENLVVFYDYDYANDIMTPEPALTKMIEERMQKYDDYSVVLPQQGKDIEVVGYVVDEANDTADRVELKLKWDGQTFSWEN